MSAGGEINSMGSILAAAKAANDTASVALDEGRKAGRKEALSELVTLMDTRAAWLRNEWMLGGNYEHLSTRRDETCYWIDKIVDSMGDKS